MPQDIDVYKLQISKMFIRSSQKWTISPEINFSIIFCFSLNYVIFLKGDQRSKPQIVVNFVRNYGNLVKYPEIEIIRLNIQEHWKLSNIVRAIPKWVTN